MNQQVKHCSGFTFIELLVVLALFVLLATLTIVVVRPRDSLVARSYLCSLRATLHALRQRAVATARPHQLVFNTSSRTYRYANTTYTLPSGVVFGALPGVKGPPSRPKVGISNSITFAGHKVLFKKDGTMNSGCIYVTDNRANRSYALSCPVGEISSLRLYQWCSDRWESLS